MCPHPPGSLQSDLKPEDSHKMKLLLGPWMTVLHDKTVAEQMVCIGSQYTPITGKENHIQLSKSSGFTDKMKKQLIDMGAFDDKQAKEDYFFNLGLEIQFRHKNPFIAYIDN